MIFSFRQNINIVSVLLCSSICTAQVSDNLGIFPYKKGSRADSMKVATRRISSIAEVFNFFEKSYLNKQLVYIPMDFSNPAVYKDVPFTTESDLRKMDLQDTSWRKGYDEADDQLKKYIVDHNRDLDKKEKQIDSFQNHAINDQVYRRPPLSRSAFEIVMCPSSVFARLNKDSPTINRIADTVRANVEQLLSGRPYNVSGYINSYNYREVKFDGGKMPELLRLLLAETLKFAKQIVTPKQYRERVKKTQLDYNIFSDIDKLWVSANASSDKIFLSPYLIRAVFNISFYEEKLNTHLAAESSRSNVGLFLSSKGQSSVSEIDSAYFSGFVDRFSKNLLFVIGHELAHLYLDSVPPGCDLETACDLYSANFLLKATSAVNPGVFETLLIKSISSNELDFWGKALNKVALQKRYDVLMAVVKNNSLAGSPCILAIPN